VTGIDRIDDPLVPGDLVRSASDLDSCIDAGRRDGNRIGLDAEPASQVNGEFIPLVEAELADVAFDDAFDSGFDDADTEFLDVDDRELLRRVRAGQDAAFAELFSRHAGVARSVALRYANDVAEAEDIAAEAFFRVLQAVRRGSGPDDNVRGYLLTVIRRLATEWRTRRRDVPVADEELSRRVDPDADQAGTRAEANLIARAFTSLPQRWRRVLWQVEVEGERPAVVAPRFGLSPNATAALARRAREGLRAAYLQAHAPSATASTACRGVIDKLGAYTAGLVHGSEAERIVTHLADCSSCRSVHAELADVCAGLRRYAGALPLPIMAPSVLHQVTPASTSLAAKSLAAKSTSLVGKSGAGKSAALAGKAVAFGVRLKLAVATMSVVVAGGLGITAGPLIMQLTGHLQADRGTQQLPVLPDGPASGSADSAARPFGPAVESTGSAVAGPRAHQNVPGAPSGSAASSSASPAAGSNNGGQHAGQVSSVPGNAAPNGGYPGASVQSLGAGHTKSPTAPPTSTISRNAFTQTPTVTPTTDPATTAQGSPTVWSTSYTTNGTTVWITRWTWVWQGGAAPPGR